MTKKTSQTRFPKSQASFKPNLLIDALGKPVGGQITSEFNVFSTSSSFPASMPFSPSMHSMCCCCCCCQ